VPAWSELTGGEVTVDAVRDDGLAGLELEPGAVEVDRDHVRLE
jgi:hypothetical protein